MCECACKGERGGPQRRDTGRGGPQGREAGRDGKSGGKSSKDRKGGFVCSLVGFSFWRLVMSVGWLGWPAGHGRWEGGDRGRRGTHRREGHREGKDTGRGGLQGMDTGSGGPQEGEGRRDGSTGRRGMGGRGDGDSIQVYKYVCTFGYWYKYSNHKYVSKK